MTDSALSSAMLNMDWLRARRRNLLFSRLKGTCPVAAAQGGDGTRIGCSDDSQLSCELLQS